MLRDETKNDERQSTVPCADLVLTLCSFVLQYLVELNYVRKTPQDFAAFIHMHHDDLDQAGIGEYLGELGKTDTDQTFMTELRRTLRRKESL
jgi:hypothetical protein